MTCRGPECTRKAKAHGLCTGHYQQQHSGKELTPIKPRHRNKRCLFPGCDYKTRAGGYCKTHYRQKRVYGIMVPLCAADLCKRRSIQGVWCNDHAMMLELTGKTSGDPDICSYPGCDRNTRIRGLCVSHYRQWCARNQNAARLTPLQSRHEPETCSFPKCVKDAAAKGLCLTHYMFEYQVRRGISMGYRGMPD